MIDVVYPVSTLSTWSDNELKYSLRSIEEFVDVNNVIIVGHKPDWMNNNVIHLNIPDPDIRRKGSNIIFKTLRGADKVTTGDFLRLSDDHIIINIPDFSPYHCGLLKSDADLNDSIYNRSCTESYKWLRKRGFPTYNYEGHYPVKVNTAGFINSFKNVNLWEPIGYVINSMYFNQIGEFPRQPEYHVLRLRTREFNPEVNKYKFLNFNDFSLSKDLKLYLQQRFPKKSRYEK